MPWPEEEITPGFPPLHGGEPANLRADIEDELADHLASATKRELRRNENESAARDAALQRFGNPQQLARRLWWDAMKGKVMRDRILIVVVLILMVCGALAALFAWKSMKQTSATNQALVAALQKLAAGQQKSGGPSISPELATYTFRVVRGSLTGPPVPDVEIRLSGKPFDDPAELTEITNQNGVVSFGPIRPGRYSVYFYNSKLPISAGNGEKEVFLFAGHDREESIIQPDVSSTHLKILADLPEDLRKWDILIGTEFNAQAETNKNLIWRTKVSAALTSDAQTYDYSFKNEPTCWIGASPTSYTIPTLNYELRQIDVGILPQEHEGQTKVYRRIVRQTFANNQLIYRAVPGPENTWKVSLPEKVINTVRQELKKDEVRKNNQAVLGAADQALASMVQERIVKVIPITKNSSPGLEDLYLGNMERLYPMLFDWPQIEKNEAIRPEHKYILALYFVDSKIQLDEGPLEVFLIKSDWMEQFPQELPRTGSEALGHYTVQSSSGWNLLDVTSAVAARAQDPQSFGLLLKLGHELHNSRPTSQATVVSRKGEGIKLNRRPLLMEVEQP